MLAVMDPRNRLHAQARLLVEESYELGVMPRDHMTPEQAREAMKRLPAPAYRHVEDVRDITLRTRVGELPARLYRPLSGSMGTVLFLHGGGWVTGGLDSSDGLCRGLAVEAHCTVLSLDYRLAPEHPFPAAVEDTWDALNGLADGRVPGVPTPSPVAVAGFSAGGNLAAVAALMARESGGPQIAYELLIAPILDCDLDRPSYFENISGLGLEREEMRWFWGHYLPDPEGRRDWRASPIRARDFRGLPPTSIVVAECDPLRDEGEAYAAQLHEAGVDVICTRWSGAHHAFFGNDRVDSGAMSLSAEATALRRAFVRAVPNLIH
jgi:acetyl esterase